ncbi:(2Fe-2S)-binding protein [Ammoniphilus sp. YIM 78166]|uniref:(2Fe-2S)-binding protein n=1 Tax=Ammoniphilus sp. YIM 78166 TaxID=1644106 RepID=UPI0010703217|nr:(2Fe-2S)-binding protein [Ammoniphilus sp. YIM 78166]
MDKNINWKFLETEYGLIDQIRRDAVKRCSLSDLVERETAYSFTQELMPLIGTKYPEVVATHFTSWFGAVCAGLQAMVSLFDVVSEVRLEHLTFQLHMDENQRKISFAHKRTKVTKAPEEEGLRNEWRSQIYDHFYANEVKPIIKSLSAVAEISENHLWAQFATRLHNEKDKWLAHDLFLARRQTINNDFYALLKDLDLTRLELKSNPFDVSFKWIEDATVPDKQIRQRSTCCLAYKRSNHPGHCYSCPRMSAEEREIKKQLIQTQG